jgi:hypothetical protein
MPCKNGFYAALFYAILREGGITTTGIATTGKRVYTEYLLNQWVYLDPVF